MITNNGPFRTIRALTTIPPPPPLPPSPLPVSDSLSARIHRPMLALIAGNNFAKRYRRRWLRHRIDSPNRLSLSLRL